MTSISVYEHARTRFPAHIKNDTGNTCYINLLDILSDYVFQCKAHDVALVDALDALVIAWHENDVIRVKDVN